MQNSPAKDPKPASYGDQGSAANSTLRMPDAHGPAGAPQVNPDEIPIHIATPPHGTSGRKTYPKLP